MRLVSRLMALIVGVLFVASAVPRAVAAVPPCDKLLTLQDVAKVAGPGFKAPPKEAAAVLGPGCFYSRRTPQADSSTLEEEVWLVFKENPGGAALKLTELSSSYRMGGAPVVAASGLGPSAFYLEDKGARSTGMFFGKGNLYLRWSMRPADRTHNAHGFIYVLEGTIVVQVKGGKEVTLTPGETFYEGPDDVHIVGRNASHTKPAKFLVVLLKEKGAPVLVPES